MHGRNTRVALIGAGFIADHHATALRDLPFVETIAVCDRHRRAAESLQRRFDIPRCHDDIDELLADPPDVAHVLVPAALHVDLATRLLSAGVHVFVEKPMGFSVEACAKLEELAAAKQLTLGVNHSECFHPTFVELRQRIEAGEIGPPQHVMSVTNVPLRQLDAGQFGHWMFQHPQNILLELATHPLSLVHSLLGDARDARTRVSNTVLLGGVQEFHKTWQAMIDCEGGHATVLFAVGSDCLVSRLSVIGPDGVLDVDLTTGALTRLEKTKWPEFYDLALNDKHNARRLRRSGRRNFLDYVLSLLKLKPRSDLFYVSMRDSIKAFHQALHENRQPPVTGAEGRAVVSMCEAVWNGKQRATPPPHVPSEPIRAETERDDTVFVTGTTGFIGGHLIERLLQAGFKIRAFVRSTSYRPPWLRHERIELVAGSLTDEALLEKAVSGCHAVLHLATGVSDTWDETKRVSVDGTRMLADLCTKHGARLVFTSTIAALYVGDLGPTDTILCDGRTDPQPGSRSIYARAKIACEDMLLAQHRDQGLAVVILRPGIVVGPRGDTRHSGLGYWPQDNHCLGWGAGQDPLPFVLAGDVADALLAAIDSDAANGKTYNLVGDVAMSARDFVAILASESQRQIHFHPQRLWLVQATDIFKWAVKIAIRKPENAFPSYRDLKTRALRAHFDCSLAKEALNWKPEADREHFVELAIRTPLKG